ncbi:hypothetical protein DFJ77DRAFT_279759 [Powellomyces hirtus]|nr:hypothetical protein DFJ77DRAFT_279759 [Powellomyces hirtus]
MWHPFTIAAMVCACLALLITLAEVILRTRILLELRQQTKRILRLQIFMLGSILLSCMACCSLVKAVQTIADVKEMVTELVKPSMLMNDHFMTIKDNNATFFLALPEIVSNSNDKDKVMLLTNARILVALGALIQGAMNEVKTPLLIRLSKYVEGSKYEPGFAWISCPPAPKTTPELLAVYTTPAQLNEGSTLVLMTAATLQSEFDAIRPTLEEWIPKGRTLNIAVTMFGWARILGAFLYGLSVLNRFALFENVLLLPRWLIPTLQVGAVGATITGVTFHMLVWWGDWSFYLIVATSIPHFYVFLLDIVVSTLMVRTLVTLPTEANVGARTGVRITVPYAQLYSLFSYLLLSLVASIGLASIDTVVGGYFQMEMTAVRELLVISTYLSGFRFLSALRTFRHSIHESSSKIPARATFTPSGSNLTPRASKSGHPLGTHTRMNDETVSPGAVPGAIV